MNAPPSRFRLPDDSTVIWHYFDFAKFVSLLDRSELFFPSASQLEDPFEGALPWPNAESSDHHHLHRDLVLVSSWHANPDESFAMWKLYARSIDAVAIRSSVGRLETSFGREDRFHMVLGQVEYIDYSRDHLPVQQALAPYFRKPKPYSYESEIRAVIDLSGAGSKSNPLVRKALREHGLYARVDLTCLIESVYVSPAAGEWFHSLVRRVLERFEFQCETRQSVLSEEPRY
jgi:hypothetical protein